MTKTENRIVDLASNSLFQYDQWRVKFLRTVLWVICGLGLLLIGAVAPSSSTNELITFGAVYLVLLVVTLVPLPYAIKAGTLVTVGYFVGAFTLIRFGPWSDSTIFFLTSTIFAALLFDERIDRWVIALNLLSLAAMGVLTIYGFINPTATGLPPSGIFDWLTYIVDYLVLAIAAAWAINLLKSEFVTVAEQLRSALLFVSKDRAELEQRVDERTAGLIKKTDQLRAVSFITRKTTEAQDLQSLLGAVSRLVSDQFGYYHTGIYLMNETGNEVVLQAASSEGGRRMVEKGHSLQVGSQGVAGYTAGQKKPRIALDVGTDAVIFDNPDLPLTRSEISLPLIIGNRVLGVLDIQSDQPQAFSLDDVDVLQTLADQIAVAIENTRLLDEAQAALMQIEMLTSVRTREAWSQRLQDGGLAYTYTPLGLRTGRHVEDSEKNLKIPITLRGQKIGAISLSRKDDAPWGETDKDLVAEVAYQTGLAIDNVRLVEEAQQRAKQEQTVGELASRFSQSMDIDTLLQTAARELGHVADVAEVSVYIGELPEQAPQKRRSKKQQVNEA